jgi:hypothetical protein
MPLDQRSRPAFVRVQRGRLQQVPQLMRHHLLVHHIQPGAHLREEFQGGFFRQDSFVLREGDLLLDLFRQGQVNRKDRARFIP